jgi:hypothetical protein
MPALSVISGEPDAVLAGIAARFARIHRIAALSEVRGLLEQQQGREPRFTTLDLIGHSTRGHRYLRIGNTPIDMLEPDVARLFRRLAESQLLPRLGIHTVRLLGCDTAVEIAGQRTMAALARTLDVRVFGTTKSLMKAHYVRSGFDPAFDRLLIEAGSLPTPRQHLM